MSAAISSKGMSLRRGATVSTSGTAVTWVSGTQFSNSILNGQSVLINGVAYTFTYVSATSGTLSASAGTQTNVQMVASTAVWGEVAEVTNITFSMKQATADVTSHQSASFQKEFIPTLKEFTITCDLNYVPTNITQQATAPGGLLSDQTNQVLQMYQLVFPDNATESLKSRYSFTAYVTDVQVKAPVAGALTGSVTFVGSAHPTLA